MIVLEGDVEMSPDSFGPHPVSWKTRIRKKKNALILMVF
jgi:hypothetical protein